MNIMRKRAKHPTLMVLSGIIAVEKTLTPAEKISPMAAARRAVKTFITFSYVKYISHIIETIKTTMNVGYASG